MRLVRVCAFWLLLTMLTACTQSPTDELATELQTVESWTATAHMAGDAWVRSAVPTAYTKQTLQTAQKELKKEADTVVQLQPAPDTTPSRAALLKELQHLEQMLEQMSAAVEREDRTAMAEQLRQLVAEEQAINALAKAAGGQP